MSFDDLYTEPVYPQHDDVLSMDETVNPIHHACLPSQASAEDIPMSNEKNQLMSTDSLLCKQIPTASNTHDPTQLPSRNVSHTSGICSELPTKITCNEAQTESQCRPEHNRSTTSEHEIQDAPNTHKKRKLSGEYLSSYIQYMLCSMNLSQIMPVVIILDIKKETMILSIKFQLFDIEIKELQK